MEKREEDAAFLVRMPREQRKELRRLAVEHEISMAQAMREAADMWIQAARRKQSGVTQSKRTRGV